MAGLATTQFGYSYIPAVSQYSAGVVAQEGMEVRRVRLMGSPVMEKAFDQIEGFLTAQGLSPQALCAFEMRVPVQFDEAGFYRFNADYLDRLRGWGIVGEQNPVARSTVVPKGNRLTGPGVHAFCYVTPSDRIGTTFAVAGSGEVPEGRDTYHDHIVAPGDATPHGIMTKGQWVLGEMTRRLQLLGQDWTSTTDLHVYTVHNFHHVMTSAISPVLLAGVDVTWHLAQPPIQGLEFEMDCRRVLHDSVLPT